MGPPSVDRASIQPLEESVVFLDRGQMNFPGDQASIGSSVSQKAGATFQQTSKLSERAHCSEIAASPVPGRRCVLTYSVTSECPGIKSKWPTIWNAQAACGWIIYAPCTCGSRDLIIYFVLSFQSWASSLQSNKTPQLNLRGLWVTSQQGLENLGNVAHGCQLTHCLQTS